MEELTIAERINHYQRKYGLSNDDLAMRLGIGRASLVKYKNKPEFFRLGVMRKMCRLFHTTMDKLFAE